MAEENLERYDGYIKDDMTKRFKPQMTKEEKKILQHLEHNGVVIKDIEKYLLITDRSIKLQNIWTFLKPLIDDISELRRERISLGLTLHDSNNKRLYISILDQIIAAKERETPYRGVVASAGRNTVKGSIAASGRRVKNIDKKDKLKSDSNESSSKKWEKNTKSRRRSKSRSQSQSRRRSKSRSQSQSRRRYKSRSQRQSRRRSKPRSQRQSRHR